MLLVYLILYILAASCFFLYTIGHNVFTRINLLGLGVFFWALVPLMQTAMKL